MLLRIHGLDTYYTEEGSGDPVLLLHGWGASSQSMTSLAAALADSFRVLAVDLPGFGWSRGPSEAWGTAEYADLLERLLEATGVGRAGLVGHSFGGHIAIRLATRQPGRFSRLALVASAGIRPRRSAGTRLRVAAAKLAKGVFSLPVWGSFGRRAIERVSERVGSRDYRAAGAMRPTLVRVVNEDVTPLLPAIQAPTLILWGDQDTEVPRAAMEIMAERIPRSRLVVFRGAGHFPFLDLPEEFCRTLTLFLRRDDPV